MLYQSSLMKNERMYEHLDYKVEYDKPIKGTNGEIIVNGTKFKESYPTICKQSNRSFMMLKYHWNNISQVKGQIYIL